MHVRRAIRVWHLISVIVALPCAAFGQQDEPSVSLTLSAGRTLDVVLDQRVTIKTVGQPVDGVIVEPLYAYDRIVVPAGTKVLGHVAALESVSKVARTRAVLSGDLTPLRKIVLEFDTLVYDDGRTVAMKTAVKAEVPNLRRTSAPATDTDPEEANASASSIGRAEREAKTYVKHSIADAKQKGRDVLAEISQPGRTERAKQALVDKLPYHPQTIGAGTGYNLELMAPLDFGRAAPAEPVTPDGTPAPSSILNARLVTMLDSSTTPRGTPISAVVTEPVFSADHHLVLPEGSTLEGEVTFATPARRFHRNGQLRFLIERVHPPSGNSSPLLASLQSVHTSGDDNVVLDDEGGAKIENRNTRFIAPALALLALRGTLDRHEHLDPDGDGHMIHSENPGAVTAGGFFGLGLLGIPLAHMAPPVGVGLSIFGAARTVYSNILAKGRELHFAADTSIQLQLAPGPAGTP